MMNRTKAFAFAAAIFAATALSATATTVTILGQSTNGVGNTANVYGAGYGANTPVGATWSANPTVTPPPGSFSGVYQSPFNNTVIADTQNYFSVGATNGSNGALSPVTLTFGAGVTSFDILWGSIDSYNTLTFNGGGGSYGGSDIAALLTPALAGSTNFEKVALVHFAFDSAVTTATFNSTSAAFEFGLAPVPLPAGGLLLLGAMGGLAALRRRKATRKSV